MVRAETRERTYEIAEPNMRSSGIWDSGYIPKRVTYQYYKNISDALISTRGAGNPRATDLAVQCRSSTCCGTGPYRDLRQRTCIRAIELPARGRRAASADAGRPHA
jgi:hypothetical protein